MIRGICRFVLLIVFISCFKTICGQDDDSAERLHHDDSIFELGLSSGVVYLADEDIYSPNIHLHLMRRLGSEGFSSRWAAGLGIESIFAGHAHYSFLATVSYNFIDDFVFDFSPGLLLAEGERQFITHMEITYESEYKGFEIGPILGAAISSDDQHYMLGLHFGKEL